MKNSVALCEQEVQDARAKLTADLAALRSPANLTAFTDELKHEAVAAKDSVVQHAKETVRTTIEEIVADLKAKAASNPAAVLTIGAGIAWQLVRNPPIVSGLIGVGIYSLLRTPAPDSVPSGELDYVDYGKQRLKQQAAYVGFEAARVIAKAGEALSEKRDEFYDTVKDKVRGLTDEAAETAADVTSTAKARTDGLAASARQTFHDALDQVEAVATHSREATATTLSEAVHSAAKRGAYVVETTSASRDSLLLVVAGVAVAAALGISIQKRITTQVD